MMMTTPVFRLFHFILLLSFIILSIPAEVPDSYFPFEFNQEEGSMVEGNVLTQSIPSDGQYKLKTNDPQPIKNYKSSNKKTQTQSTKPLYKDTQLYKQNSNLKQNNNQYETNSAGYKLPTSHMGSLYINNSPSTNSQWESIQNHLNRLFPAFFNTRIVYF